MLEITMQTLTKLEKRNVVLKIKTYERLEKYKIKLINEMGDSRITFDDAINTLLVKESKMSKA